MSSTTARELPKWPPLLETAYGISSRRMNESKSAEEVIMIKTTSQLIIGAMPF